MLVANMEADTLRQSAQWQTKVLTSPGALRGYVIRSVLVAYPAIAVRHECAVMRCGMRP